MTTTTSGRRSSLVVTLKPMAQRPDGNSHVLSDPIRLFD